MPSPNADLEVDDRLREECVRLADRYVREVVLAHRLCPWAKQSVTGNRVKIEPILARFSQKTDSSNSVRSISHALSDVSSEYELVLLPLPRFEDSRLAMDSLLRDVRTELRGTNCENTFALAAFHPEAAPNFHSPEAMIPYFRRTPFPLLQGIRTSVLEAISSHGGSGTAFVDPTELLRKLEEPPRVSLREEIAKANVETLEKVGMTAMNTLFDDLLDDALATLGSLDGAGTDRSAWTRKGAR